MNRHPLRIARKSHNLSIEELAQATKLSYRTIWRAEHGHVIHPSSRRMLCDYLQMTSEELGLITGSHTTAQQKTEKAELQSLADKMVAATERLENEGVDMKRSRRHFIQMFGAVSISLNAFSNETVYSSTAAASPSVSESTVENLASITEQFRLLQRAGLPTEAGLKDHIDLIQSALENTTIEKLRRELWRILAQSQLLARHSIIQKQFLGRARTWNESAIASAQYSGDALLMAAALGHLGHLYLIWTEDVSFARQLLNQAYEYAQNHPINGWFAMVMASIAAKEGRKQACEASIEHATEAAHSISAPEYTDLYYTDFNKIGTDAFAGNCLLKIGEPKKALERLTSMELGSLSGNRQATALYDIAHAHIMLGNMEAAQPYAFQSIDKAVATNRYYVIPRFVNLAREIQTKYHQQAHASAIMEYAHVALQQNAQRGV